MSVNNLWAGYVALVMGVVPALVSAQATGWNQGIINAGAANLPGGSLTSIIVATLSWLLGILGFIAIAAFVISGIQYLLSAGDEGMIDRAKTHMKYSLVGVIVALGGYVVVLAVSNWLTGTSVTF